MSGKTLINTETRNEVLQFLHELSLGSNVAGISTKAYELHNKMCPKFIRGTKLVPTVVVCNFNGDVVTAELDPQEGTSYFIADSFVQT